MSCYCTESRADLELTRYGRHLVDLSAAFETIPGDVALMLLR
jgi:hypothetical protein